MSVLGFGTSAMRDLVAAFGCPPHSRKCRNLNSSSQARLTLFAARQFAAQPRSRQPERMPDRVR